MQVNIRITSVNSKWTSFQYLSSTAKSRMLTKTLVEAIKKGSIKAINEEMMEGYA